MCDTAPSVPAPSDNPSLSFSLLNKWTHPQLVHLTNSIKPVGLVVKEYAQQLVSLEISTIGK